MMSGFFSQLDDSWEQYRTLRSKYSDSIPIPQSTYFRPIRDINELATVAIRPIEKPLYLGINALAFFVKAILNLITAILLAPCALILLFAAPNSRLKSETNSSFKLAIAQTMVDCGMTGLALVSTALALIFNPLQVASRLLATGVDYMNTTTESCCGLTIAKF